VDIEEEIILYIVTSVHTITIALVCTYFLNIHDIILVGDDKCY